MSLQDGKSYNSYKQQNFSNTIKLIMILKTQISFSNFFFTLGSILRPLLGKVIIETNITG